MTGRPTRSQSKLQDRRRLYRAWPDYAIERIFCLTHNLGVPKCEVEFTDEFAGWWDGLTEQEQISVAAHVEVLEQFGPTLGSPRSSQIRGSKHGGMRELRVQCQGRPIRVLYAFDPRRAAILLIGGDKGGNDRWYDEFVPKADALFDAHLKSLALEESQPRDP